MLYESSDPVVERLMRLARLSFDLGRVDRMTRAPDGLTFESDTDHTVMLALVVAELCPPSLNRERAMALAVVHDLVEAYAGDTPTLVISPAQRAQKVEREVKALERLRSELQGSPVLDLLSTYEAHLEPEARLVRLLDKLLPKLTHTLNGGAAVHPVLSVQGLVERHTVQLEAMRQEYARDAWANPLLDALEIVMRESERAMAASEGVSRQEPLPLGPSSRARRSRSVEPLHVIIHNPESSRALGRSHSYTCPHCSSIAATGTDLEVAHAADCTRAQ